MGAINPYVVSSKALERHTVRSTGAISVGRCVTYTGGQVGTLGAAAIGIAVQNAASAGVDIPVTTEGTEAAEAGAAIASIGSPLTPDATGRLIVATVTGQFILARSLGTAGAAGEFIEVHITREGKF